MEKIKQEMTLKNWDNDLAASIYSDSIYNYKEGLGALANSILSSNLNDDQKIEKWNKESEQWHNNYCKKYFEDNYDDLKSQTKDMLIYALENQLNINEVIGSYDDENEISDYSIDCRIDNNIGYECDNCYDEVIEEIDFESLVENGAKKYESEE